MQNAESKLWPGNLDLCLCIFVRSCARGAMDTECVARHAYSDLPRL
jgi:hypothetical protein